jgi:hypothetical protein
MRILGGEIECKIHTTAAGYSDEQTHHWLIGGTGAITHNQILHIAATWSVTGNGKLTETQGNQTRKAHWNTQGTKPAPMQVRLSSPTVPAPPPTIILESAHSQLSVPNGITGVQQLTIGGQPQTPGQIGLQAWEFTPFPVLLWNLKVGAPCLRTKTDKLPSGDLWLHEIKHDGFRVIARKDGDRVRLSHHNRGALDVRNYRVGPVPTLKPCCAYALATNSASFLRA